MADTPSTSPVAQEPSVSTASITAGVAAVIALLVAFGVPLTGDQKVAILGVVAVVAPFIVGVVVRRLVVPNANVVELVPRAQVSQEFPTVIAGPANDLATPGQTVRQLNNR